MLQNTRYNLNIPELIPYPKRILVLIGAFLLIILPGEYGNAARGAMTDSYGGVAVFVYVTLFMFYWAETRFNFNILEQVYDKHKLQIVFAALMGMMPGCGGAILVVTGYASGQLSFGALVATLTATMGDAAFLLLAEDPIAAAIVLPISAIIGIITGILVDIFYRRNPPELKGAQCSVAVHIGKVRYRDWLVFALFLPGIIIGVTGLMQYELPSFFDQIALLGMILTIGVWVFSPVSRITNPSDAPMVRSNEETAFVMIWVVTAFLLFDMSDAIFGFNFNALFAGVVVWTPLIATLVGFLPGCGPQIIVTTLYLSGAIPFGALTANAISNDGDALFPAIAIAPQDAIIATLITAVPAVITGYMFLFFLPNL